MPRALRPLMLLPCGVSVMKSLHAMIVAACLISSATSRDCSDDDDSCNAPSMRADVLAKGETLSAGESVLQQINADLVSWMKQEGAFIHPCIEARLCEPYGGRCLGTSCDLKKDELLISVPPALQIRPYETSAKSSCPHLPTELEKVKEWNIKENEVLLVLQLLDNVKRHFPRSISSADFDTQEPEDKSNGFWRYVLSVPREYPYILSSEDDQRQCLNGTNAKDNVARRFERERAKVRVIQNCASVSESLARWAKLTVDTRCFSGSNTSSDLADRTKLIGDLKGKTKSEWMMLVPFADIFNDERVETAQWGMNFKTDSFEVHALSSIAKGSEVVISYGPKGNGHLLTKYGFLHTNNPEDSMAIYLKDNGPFGPPPPMLALAFSLESDHQMSRALRSPLLKIRMDLKHQPDAPESEKDLELAVLRQVKERCLAAAPAPLTGSVHPSSEWLCRGYRDGLTALTDSCIEFVEMATKYLEVGGEVSPSRSGETARLGTGLYNAWREQYAKF
eukprot:TRINITY_DN36556_c0_g1_i2.p1 TRINITY_DN36556_c0_g1~~TRINITY_DN36556_c0_g1_i2.p1  ORF type:complete len:507 (-),score=59.25 TRINITY_DN36556_c0_g1_i2:25-1545(-)